MDECDMDIQFCRQLQCQNTVGTYTCGCRQGFKKIVSGNDYTCADIDECSNRNTCPENAICQNLDGNYKCTCDSGYEGDTCSDVDECFMNKAKCDANADCNNTPGSFDCECRTGFFGTGQKCEKGQCQAEVGKKQVVYVSFLDMIIEKGVSCFVVFETGRHRICFLFRNRNTET